jgi:spoIIIJ-associated protein
MTLEEFLKGLVQSTHLNLSFQIDQRDEEIQVNLKGHDDSFILARNAELLHSLEYLCNRMFEKQDRKIIFDCNGYRAIRAEELRLMALAAAEKVKQLGKPFKLSPMSPEERRIVHLAVAEDNEIRTESEGFGENRKVVIYPKRDGVAH